MYLHMSLFEDSDIAVGTGIGNLVRNTQSTKPLV